MASFVKKTMLYLGLGSDEDFQALDQGSRGDSYRGAPEGEINLDANYEPRLMAEPVGAGVGAAAAGSSQGLGIGAELQAVRPAPAQSAVRMLAPEDAPASTERATPSLVRTLPPAARRTPQVVAPGSFDDAQEVADRFREGSPVVMNLQAVSTELSRRLMDFTSGLCYGMGGKMKKVGHRVYLLTPDEVDVSAEDRDRLREAGLHD